jgi:hypothetical protein
LLQSKKGAELIYKYPILLDACANEMQVRHWVVRTQIVKRELTMSHCMLSRPQHLTVSTALTSSCISCVQAKGDAMMSKWAEVMTNMRPKTYFLRPDVAIPLGIALVREVWNQKVCTCRCDLG